MMAGTTIDEALRRWSASKVKVAKTCPHQFWHRYVWRTPSLPVDGPYAIVGSALHSAIEHLIRETKAGRPLDLDAAMSFALTENEMTSMDELRFVRARTYVDVFVRRYIAWRKQFAFKAELIEGTITLDQGMNPVPAEDPRVYLTAIVDLGFSFQGGGRTAYPDREHMVLLDHKTGKPQDMPFYDTQLQLYTLAAFQAYPSVEAVRCGIHFLRNGNIVMTPEYVTREEDLPRLKAWALGELSGAKKAVAEGSEPIVGPWCRVCSYKADCTAHSGRTRR